MDRVSGNYVQPGIRQHGIVVPHLDEAHRCQLFQVSRVDRRQYPTFCLDVPERPTQVNRLLKVEIGKGVLRVGHLLIKSRAVALGNTELHAAIKAVVNLAGIDQIFSLALPTQTKAFHREVLLPQPTSATNETDPPAFVSAAACSPTSISAAMDLRPL
jgi:hypothetical protein